MSKPSQDPVRTLLADNLKRYRHSLGYSQEKMAELLNIGSSMLAAIENQEKFPSSTSLDKISRGLNIPVHELFLPSETKPSRDLHDLGSLKEDLKNKMNLMLDEAFIKHITK